MGLQVEIPKDKSKLQRQIEALEWQLTQDVRSEDKAIHQYALEQLRQQLSDFNLVK